jgi:hypothetical protein
MLGFSLNYYLHLVALFFYTVVGMLPGLCAKRTNNRN